MLLKGCGYGGFAGGGEAGEPEGEAFLVAVGVAFGAGEGGVPSYVSVGVVELVGGAVDGLWGVDFRWDTGGRWVAYVAMVAVVLLSCLVCVCKQLNAFGEAVSDQSIRSKIPMKYCGTFRRTWWLLALAWVSIKLVTRFDSLYLLFFSLHTMS